MDAYDAIMTVGLAAVLALMIGTCSYFESGTEYRRCLTSCGYIENPVEKTGCIRVCGERCATKADDGK